MNCTLRVITSQRRFIVKQARPWVERYDHLAAPWDRMLAEQRFYARVAAIPEVAGRMPRVLGSDPAARVLVLEDIPGARDLTGIYRGERLAAEDLPALAHYLCALHRGTVGTRDAAFANRAMRALNHAHLFVVPLDAANGVDLDRVEPGLAGAARRLCEDPTYCAAVAALGERYLADGDCLVHGDYFPGSWLRNAERLWVIDPEFCFFGDPEGDLGCAVAHLALGACTWTHARSFLALYQAPYDLALVARYAAVEVMRRLIGVAQLPIPPSDGFRAMLIARSRRALLEGTLNALWS
jgi:5-methylthioribose kinase